MHIPKTGNNRPIDVLTLANIKMYYNFICFLLQATVYIFWKLGFSNHTENHFLSVLKKN